MSYVSLFLHQVQTQGPNFVGGDPLLIRFFIKHKSGGGVGLSGEYPPEGFTKFGPRTKHFIRLATKILSNQSCICFNLFRGV